MIVVPTDPEVPLTCPDVAPGRVEDVQRYTVERIADIRTTAEGQEGLRAFLEKRRPSWTPKGEEPE